MAASVSDNDSARHCHAVWAGKQHTDVGLLCTELRPSFSELTENHSLHISYELKEGWQLQECFLWLGSDLSGIPKKQGTAQPSLMDFPYINRNIGKVQTYDISVPLEEINGPRCALGKRSQSLFAAIHPVITKGSNNATIYEQSPPTVHKRSLRRKLSNDNNILTKSGIWWMELEMLLSCHRSVSDDKVVALSPNLRQVKYRRQLTQFQGRDPSTAHCPTTASNIKKPDELITEDFLFRFHLASVLSLQVAFDSDMTSKTDYYRSIYDRFDGFDDGLDDAAVVAKVNDTCFGVFRGTVKGNYADMAQNFEFGFRKVPGTECYVRIGYYDCYFTNYQPEFDQSIRDCVASCIEEDGKECELVMTGASQGGAASVVASIYFFNEYDPYIFTFGAPRTFLPTSPFDNHTLCVHINKDKQYHFVLTDPILKVFDPTPYYYAFWTKNVGREILFDGDGNFNDQGVAPNYIMAREPTNHAIHSRSNYDDKTEKAYKNACLPAPAHGWFDGHWCSEDGDCQLTSYCNDDGYCAPSYVAASSCQRDGECLSGSCKDNICSATPKSLTENGARCGSNDECSSGRCDGWPGFSQCHAQEESGARCNEHSDCLSGHCAGLILGKCT